MRSRRESRVRSESEIAKQIAGALNRPLGPAMVQQHPRYSRDPLAYAEFMRGYRLSASGDSILMERATHHLTNAVTRDPTFALAHATLSFACTTRHFEFDPASAWLEKAEFHCRRALEIDPDFPKDTSPALFSCGGPRKTSSIWRRLPNSSAPSPCRTIFLMPTIVSAPSWHISGCSITLVKCTNEDGLFIPERQSVPASSKSTLWNQEYSNSPRSDSKPGGRKVQATSTQSILLRSRQ